MVAMPPQQSDEMVNGSEELPAKYGLTPRSYQLEMVEESMRKNIIVAMDTGSGKTLMYSLLLFSLAKSKA